MFFLRYPRTVLALVGLLCLGGGYAAWQRLTFRFDLEDFFPKEDADLTYFKEFKERFDPDDNFMMVGLRRAEGIFDSAFLQKALAFSKDFRRLEFVMARPLQGDSIDGNIYDYRAEDSVLVMRPITSVQSVLSFEYPIKTPLLGFTSIPAVHIDQPEYYEQDKERISSDERLRGILVSKDMTTLVLFAKTHTKTSQYVAKSLVKGLEALLQRHGFEEYHLLGPAYFQTKIPETQIREFVFSTVVSFFLILVVMSLIFRRFWGVMVALTSISVGLILFVGILGVWGRELDTMSMLYPIIMIIVGTSDVIHVMSKYADELNKGYDKMSAIRTTIREIGLSVFLTSATTAIGFLSLMSSRVEPIQNFGLNAAVGVLTAYATVMVLTTSLLVLFDREQIARIAPQNGRGWQGLFYWLHGFTRRRGALLMAASLVCLGLCAWGISKVTTNNRIEDLLPRGEKVTEDFKFFERQLSGFRPMEIAIELKGDYKADQYEVLSQVERLEQHLRTYPDIQSVASVTAVYKSINRAVNGDRPEAYVLPQDAESFAEVQKLSKRFLKTGSTPLVSRDGKALRVSARFLDIGADNSRRQSESIRRWIQANMDPSIAEYRQTGTGILVDKNAEYMRDSLLWGLGFAFIVISVIMGLLYRSFKMVFIALLPNLPPLAVAGAILGFMGIPLDAGVAIVFSIIFGIAVDDTIHVLGRFRLLQMQGKGIEEALLTTLSETGKAVCLTSLILFAGFLILLFSSNPPAQTVGLLISLTLFSALLFDLFVLPVLLRFFIKDALKASGKGTEDEKSQPAVLAEQH